MDVKKHRPGRIRVIRHMNFSFGQFPDQPGLYRSKQQLSFCGERSRSLHMIQDPFDLGRGKVRIDDKPCFLPVLVLQAFFL